MLIGKHPLSCLLICILVFAGPWIIGCNSGDGITVIKLAHVLDTSHPVHQAMRFVAERVAEKSAGRMRVDIYPGGQLGGERDLIELLQIGSLAMTKVSTAPLEGFVPEMKIFGVPYVFRDDEHRWRVLNGPIGKRLLRAGEPYYLRGMCYYDSGSRSFYTKEKPVNAPPDLAGLKIRVMKSITSMTMVQTLGGSATPLPWGEIYTSLQQGIVDGAENNPPSFYLSKHYEVCNYFSLDEHTAIPDIIIMSTVVWNSLDEDEQQWLQEALDESVEYQRRLWKEATDEALEAVVAAGVQLIYPDKKPFQQAVKSMHESFKGSPVYELIQQISAEQ